MGIDDSAVFVYVVYLSTLVPWAVMQFFDAIDDKRRPVREIPLRLSVSLFLVTCSTVVGVIYIVVTGTDSGRDSASESATMLLSVVLNGWHWMRNYRGWTSYNVLVAQKKRVCELVRSLMTLRLQGMSTDGSDAAEQGAHVLSVRDCEECWKRFWVNNTVIDNDPRKQPVALHSLSM